MRGRGRGRGRGRAEVVKVSDSSEDEAAEMSAAVVISSDEEEANGDLSLDLIRRAKAMEAKRRSEGQLVFLDNLPPPPSSNEVAVAAKSSRAGEAASVTERKKKRLSRGKKRKENGTAEQKLMDGVTAEMKNFEGRAAEAKEMPLMGDRTSGVPEEVSKVEEYPVIVKVIDLEAVELLDNVAKPVSTNETGVADNSVFRKLLRGPRYFDPPESHSETCYNCGKEGHVMANCPSEKRKKPCFVCGNFGHSARRCLQGQDCFSCRKRGHLAKDCPEKNRRVSESGKICLRCGESGHDMPSCRNDYAPADMKEIQCYICKNYGHLCCADSTDAGPREVSCYSCGQSGHLGVGCAKLCGNVNGSTSPTLCYKCGEEGHFARGCTKSARSIQRHGEQSTAQESFLRKHKYGDARTLSVPADFGKPYKKKTHKDDKRCLRSSGKSKWRGGWAMDDDPGNITGGIKSKVDNWSSPASMGREVHRTPTSGSCGWPSPSMGRGVHRTPTSGSGGWHWESRSPLKRQKLFPGSSSSHGPMTQFHHDFTPSRFGNNIQSRFWRYY